MSVRFIKPQTRDKLGRNAFFLPDFQSDGFTTEQSLNLTLTSPYKPQPRNKRVKISETLQSITMPLSQEFTNAPTREIANAVADLLLDSPPHEVRL